MRPLPLRIHEISVETTPLGACKRVEQAKEQGIKKKIRWLSVAIVGNTALFHSRDGSESDKRMQDGVLCRSNSRVLSPFVYPVQYIFSRDHEKVYSALMHEASTARCRSVNGGRPKICISAIKQSPWGIESSSED